MAYSEWMSPRLTAFRSCIEQSFHGRWSFQNGNKETKVRDRLPRLQFPLLETPRYIEIELLDIHGPPSPFHPFPLLSSTSIHRVPTSNPFHPSVPSCLGPLGSRPSVSEPGNTPCIPPSSPLATSRSGVPAGGTSIVHHTPFHAHQSIGSRP